MIINKRTILSISSSLLSLTMILLVFSLFVSDAFAASTCPNTWQPAYAVDCIDPAYPYACGFSASGLPQCKASLPTTICNGGTIDYNCNSCTASCQCPSGQILCSGTCKAPLSNPTCTTQNRDVDPCTGTCGACKTGYTDCSGTCKLSSSPTCVSPNVYNPCTGACTAPTRYIEASPATAQADFINISRDVRAASSTMVGAGYFGGEAMFGSYWNGSTMTSPISLSKGKNLFYGQINNVSTDGNFVLLEKGNGLTASPLFAIDYLGRVGIGTTTPKQPLHIQGGVNSWSGLRVNRGGDPTYFEILHYGGSGSGTMLSQSGNMPIRFFTSSTERMKISGDGKIGIGTASPNKALHVFSAVENAEIDIQSGNNRHWGIYQVNGATNVDSVLRFWQTDDVFELKGDNSSIAGNQSQVIVKNELCLGGACKSSWPGGGVYSSGAAANTGGGALTGYKGYNNLCPTGSHVCTTEEILNSINQNASTLPTSGDYWVNGGNPGGITTAMNDCKGRTSNSNSDLGFFWRFNSNGGSVLLTSCNTQKMIACCR